MPVEGRAHGHVGERGAPRLLAVQPRPAWLRVVLRAQNQLAVEVSLTTARLAEVQLQVE